MILFARTILVVIIFSLCLQFSGKAQNTPIRPANKGKLYILWGWNWGYYSKSDIHFTGDNYDFVLEDVKAEDRQTQFSWDTYFNPLSITIPQTNFRVGYYVSDNWNLSFGVDHMKYFVTRDQSVKINGFINEGGNEFDGIYNNDDIILAREFLQFEHSDGLNYINAEVSYVKDLMTWIGNPKEKLQIYLTGGVGVGFLLPKTNSVLMGQQRHDDFNVAGYGMALKGGINITFFKYFFIQSELKGGFINMTNIRTSPDKSDSASQHFYYLMPDILFGAIFRIANK
jgi:hypothetical protein